jgi:16S rRNA (guanine527-N7)-methyltransferase
LLNSAVVADLVPDRCVLADLGSGAGLPGLVLAMVRPECRVILIEPMARRTDFLRECADTLALANVEVCRGRGEELAGTIGADVVTARAVASLDRLAPLAAGLARAGGQVLAIKGASAADEVESARSVLRRLGAVDVEVLTVGSGVLDQPTTVVRFVVPAVPGLPVSGGGRRRDARPPRQPGPPRRPRRTG